MTDCCPGVVGFAIFAFFAECRASGCDAWRIQTTEGCKHARHRRLDAQAVWLITVGSSASDVEPRLSLRTVARQRLMHHTCRSNRRTPAVTAAYPAAAHSRARRSAARPAAAERLGCSRLEKKPAKLRWHTRMHALDGLEDVLTFFGELSIGHPVTTLVSR